MSKYCTYEVAFGRYYSNAMLTPAAAAVLNCRCRRTYVKRFWRLRGINRRTRQNRNRSNTETWTRPSLMFCLRCGQMSRHLDFLAHLLVQLQFVRPKWTFKHHGKHTSRLFKVNHDPDYVKTDFPIIFSKTVQQNELMARAILNRTQLWFSANLFQFILWFAFLLKVWRFLSFSPHAYSSMTANLIYFL